jgi:hypothetical protein
MCRIQFNQFIVERARCRFLFRQLERSPLPRARFRPLPPDRPHHPHACRAAAHVGVRAPRAPRRGLGSVRARPDAGGSARTRRGVVEGRVILGSAKDWEVIPADAVVELK